MLPMQPYGPCFATPVFSTPTSNWLWYQGLSPQRKITSFDLVDTSLNSRVQVGDEPIVRTVGQVGIFGFWRSDNALYIGEPTALVPVLVEEFKSNKDRLYLRYAIAKFVESEELVAESMTQIKDAESARVSVSRPKAIEDGFTMGGIFVRITVQEKIPRLILPVVVTIENMSTIPRIIRIALSAYPTVQVKDQTVKKFHKFSEMSVFKADQLEVEIDLCRLRYGKVHYLTIMLDVDQVAEAGEQHSLVHSHELKINLDTFTTLR